MCDFPSWFEHGFMPWHPIKSRRIPKLLYLEDKDLDSINFYGDTGHSVTAKFWGISEFTHGLTKGEGFPCPPEIARSIRNGRMDKIQHRRRMKVHASPEGNLIWKRDMSSGSQRTSSVQIFWPGTSLPLAREEHFNDGSVCRKIWYSKEGNRLGYEVFKTGEKQPAFLPAIESDTVEPLIYVAMTYVRELEGKKL